VVAAAIILLVVGIGGAIYNAWDLVLLVGDLGLARELGLGGRFFVLIAIDVGLVVAGVVQIVAGVRLFSASRAARTLGVAASFAVIALWVASLLLITAWELTLLPHAWAVLVVSSAGSLLAAIFLLASPSRAFTREVEPIHA
jgi:hypothetical protein